MIQPIAQVFTVVRELSFLRKAVLDAAIGATDQMSQISRGYPRWMVLAILLVLQIEDAGEALRDMLAQALQIDCGRVCSCSAYGIARDAQRPKLQVSSPSAT